MPHLAQRAERDPGLSRLCGRPAGICRAGSRREWSLRAADCQQPWEEGRLYWPQQPGEEESPLGELAASAAAEGYDVELQRRPYHGYYYRVLTEGPNAPGGTLDYIVRGNMIGGFALVAYPAQYGNSGVMTFLVNHQGVIYEKDLGRRTPAIAAGMTAFNPDHTWRGLPTQYRPRPSRAECQRA